MVLRPCLYTTVAPAAKRLFSMDIGESGVDDLAKIM